MSLSSHAGKDTFTIAGKSINKRDGTSNIYDIAAGSNSFMSGLNMETHDYRLYGNNDLNNRTTLTIPNFTSSSKVLLIHDNHPGNVSGDVYEIMRQTLLGPGDSATIQLGAASPAVTFTLSESGVLDGSWPLGSGSNGTYRTISVCHFYTVTQSGSLEERIAALEAGGGLTPTWYGHWFTSPVFNNNSGNDGFILRDTDDNPATSTQRQNTSLWNQGGNSGGNVGYRYYDYKQHDTNTSYAVSTDQSWRLLSAQVASKAPCEYTATETRQVTFNFTGRCEVVLNDRRVFVTSTGSDSYSMWVKSGDVYHVRPQFYVDNPHYSWHETHFA